MNNYVVTIGVVTFASVQSTNLKLKLTHTKELYVPSFCETPNVNNSFIIQDIVDEMFDFYKYNVSTGLSLYSYISTEQVKTILEKELISYMRNNLKRTKNILYVDTKKSVVTINIKQV